MKIALLLLMSGLVLSSALADGIAFDFKITIDPAETPLEAAQKLTLPNGAEKAFERYSAMAERGHMVVLEPKLTDVDGNALLASTKGVSLTVRATKQLNSYVLLMANVSTKTNIVAVDIVGLRKLAPIYRRVYRPDGTDAWDTLAWEPPQSPDRPVWTIELPPQTAQTVTIKTAKKK